MIPQFFVKLLGLSGGSCFAYCGIPAAIATIRAKKSIGTPVSIAWGIVAGVVLTYSYILLAFHFDWVITINDLIEFSAWATIIFYHYKGKYARK